PCSPSIPIIPTVTPAPRETSAPPPQLLPRRGSHLLDRKPKLLLQLLQRRRRPERLHADDRPGRAHVLVPAERGRLLDRHARLHTRRDHALAVLRGLVLEHVPRGHAHHAGLDPFALELLVCPHA